MKKLYIGFILLFGFLTFVPQIAVGDSLPIDWKEWEKQKKAEIKSRKIFNKSLQCLYEKKLKLPKEYSGPNLKVERVFYNGSDFIQKIGNTGNKYIVETTKYIYNSITLEDEQFFGIGNATKHLEESFIGRECTEYIEFSNNLWVYDVTNVPAGSRLRYIPSTEEMEVLPPADDSQKKFMAEQKERMRKSRIICKILGISVYFCSP